MTDQEFDRYTSAIHNVLGNKRVKVYRNGVLISEFQIPVLRHTTTVTFQDGRPKCRITRCTGASSSGGGGVSARMGWRLEAQDGTVLEARVISGGDIRVGELTLHVNRSHGVSILTDGRLVGELKAASSHTHRLRLEKHVTSNSSSTRRDYLHMLLIFLFCQYPDHVTLYGTGTGNAIVGLMGVHAVLATMPAAAVF